MKLLFGELLEEDDDGVDPSVRASEEGSKPTAQRLAPAESR
jgi:hypothetical protein